MNAIELCILAAIWGASFLFMRVGAAELGPVPLVALRVLIAVIALSPALRSQAVRHQLRTHIKPLFIVGMTNSTLPFCLLTYATLYVSAGVDSILNATTPLWTAVIAYCWLGIPINKMQRLGMSIGFLGVVTLTWDAVGMGRPGSMLAVVAALCATLCYGFSVNYSKRNLVGVDPIVSVIGSQFCSVLVLMPFAFGMWPSGKISMSTWYAVLALGILCTAVAYILYFRLIARVGASYAASVTFLIPVFGVLWGHLFLAEQINHLTGISCLIIVAGTLLGSGKIPAPRFLSTVSKPQKDASAG